MSFIFIFIGLMLLLDLLWWWLLARLTFSRSARLVVGIFMAAQMLGLIWLIGGRLLQRGWDRALPKFAITAIFIWHFMGLGLFSAVGIAVLPIFVIWKIASRNRDRGVLTTTSSPNNAGRLSRREFLGFAAAIAPPLFTLSLSSVALRQLNHFRVRRFVLPIRNLPSDLDGTTIAQVSDIHVGRFTSGQVLKKMVNTVNELRSDLILLTGDLINDSLTDLSEGLDLVRAMDARFGSYLIEGNHDLIDNGPKFESRVKASGIPFLLDESTIVQVRGGPIQLLGLSWTRTRGKERDHAISQSVCDLLRQQTAGAFPILLAHHPHAFDAAAAAGLPLTLSGHTHGGQLMLNEQAGFGPAMFRYWSGLYERRDSKLIVSNGVGNWFPLRINAPAEIVHLTLRRS
jgi:predicted MPP superfamily phosphohydrolase